MNPGISRILENIVYLELLRRGFQVSIGKVGDLEIDFVADRAGDRVYYQVAASIFDPATFAREIAPLQKLADHYPKFLITMDEISVNEDGIRQINMVDFLLDKTESVERTKNKFRRLFLKNFSNSDNFDIL